MEPATKLDPMTETALRSLHDIALPPPVSWMPQTWGWAVLAAIAVATLLGWAILALRRYRRNAYRREALRLLSAAASDLRNPDTRRHGAQKLAELMKRTALAAWPREKVAAVTAGKWNAMIGASVEGGEAKALAQLIDDLEYRSDDAMRALPAGAADDIVAGARRWIETHHVPA
jgi:signal transduction histidine kinase